MLVWGMWYIHTVLQPSLLPSTSIRDYPNAWRPPSSPSAVAQGYPANFLRPHHTPSPSPVPSITPFPVSHLLTHCLLHFLLLFEILLAAFHLEHFTPGFMTPACLGSSSMLSLNYKPDVFPALMLATAHITYRVSSSFFFCQGNTIPFTGRIL